MVCLEITASQNTGGAEMSEAFLLGNGQVHRLVGPRGDTPACPEAKFKRGDIVKVRRNQTVGHFPPELVVLVAIPPGFSPDDAMADLLGQSRPFMKQVGRRVVTYLLCEQDGHQAYLCRERDLLPSGKPPIEIGSVSEWKSDQPPVTK